MWKTVRASIACLVTGIAFVACMSPGPEPEEGSNAPGASEEIERVAEAAEAVVQCGETCSAGYHPTASYCLGQCGACIDTGNAADCQANTTSFAQCGARSCPTGYYLTSQFDSSSCDGSPNSPYYYLGDNAGTCQQLPASGTIYKCIASCPSGWTQTSVFHSTSCQGTGNNAAGCTK